MWRLRASLLTSGVCVTWYGAEVPVPLFREQSQLVVSDLYLLESPSFHQACRFAFGIGVEHYASPFRCMNIPLGCKLHVGNISFLSLPAGMFCEPWHLSVVASYVCLMVTSWGHLVLTAS